MVWFYGGAYKLGASGFPGYDARGIARDGDLVVVTFNYRVGIERFASIEGALANRGLLDQAGRSRGGDRCGAAPDTSGELLTSR